jgi:hypothetical protein
MRGGVDMDKRPSFPVALLLMYNPFIQQNPFGIFFVSNCQLPLGMSDFCGLH